MIFVSFCSHQVPFPEDVGVVDVAAGAFHSMALSSQGNVWIWGRDSSVCSEGNIMKPEVFVALEGPDGVPKCKAICCNGEHSLAITQSGQVGKLELMCSCVDISSR